MRVAIIVIGIAMVSTPSHASKSCMTLAEARQAFGQVHLWWHGSGHCWDASASAGKHGYIHRARRSEVKEAARDEEEEADTADAADSRERTDAGAKPPKWRDARSEMLPVDAPVFRSAAAAFPAATLPIMQPGEVQSSVLDWLDRWVDIAQVFPRNNPVRAEAPSASAAPATAAKAEPLVTPVRVILAFLAIALTLAVIEILFRSTIHEYRK
jgi:hypothetical protein